MTEKTMLLGPLDHMLAVPWPQTGMNWNQTRDAETTELLSGGRHVYTAPTPFRSYSLNYKGGTAGLQNIVDLYTGVYGPGPFYLTEFNYSAGNILPTRWATAYMLGYVAGSWGNPTVQNATAALAGKAVTFSNTQGQYPEAGISQIIACVPDTPAYLHLWGTRTGTASVRISLRAKATGIWTAPVNYVPSAAPGQSVLISAADGTANTYSAMKLELFVPSSSSLTLDHINITGISGNNVRLPGLGVGAVKFSSDLSGTIQTKRFDRIGLSLDIVEVE
jgi:hypothetical protein